MIIGKNSYYGWITNNFNIAVEIGNYVSIGDNLTIIGGRHPMNCISTFPFKERLNLDYTPCSCGEAIIIGNDVWIGANVSIMEGVTIGDGAVIGACSVVTKDIEPYNIVAGNPARFIRYRFRDQIGALLKIKWWDWDESIIRERIKDFQDIEGFVEKYG